MSTPAKASQDGQRDPDEPERQPGGEGLERDRPKTAGGEGRAEARERAETPGTLSPFPPIGGQCRTRFLDSEMPL